MPILFIELFQHQTKIIKFSKQPESDSFSILYNLLQHIEFYNEALIEQNFWEEAEHLTKGIDQFDMNYVALALKTNGWLWTGVKKLTLHLKSLKFERVINTSQLYEKLEIG